MSKAKTAIGALALSAAAFVGLLTTEGYTGKAIIPTKGDVPTVGFGTTGGVKMGDTTNPVAAVQRALKDTAMFEGAIRRCVTAPLSQVEYDVYTSMAYNIGASAFCTSSIVKNINAKNYVAACGHITDWKYVSGFDCSTPNNRVCAGLWKRRLDDRSACLAAQ